MDRRIAIKNISLLLGGAMIGMDALLTGCRTSDKKADSTGADSKVEFSTEDVAFLDEVADTILPTTASSPGAKAAKVGQFMTVMVNDCYEAKDQKIFHNGINKLQKYAKDNGKKDFMQMTPQERTALLTKLDAEASEYQKNKKEGDDNHYFRMMKELTLLGYFTSEIGMTQARRYKEVPGSYQGCVPYTKGEKAWA